MAARLSARRDLLAGAVAALVMLAVEGSYGLIAFSPLGPESAKVGFALAVLTAVYANVAVGLGGARGPALAGTSAPLALLVAALLATLHAAQVPVAAQFALLALGTALAGVATLVLGALRVGRVVRYVPYPVHAGFSAGIALLMAIAIAPHALGLPPGRRVADGWADTAPLALLVTAVTLAVALKAPARPVPRPLAALLVGCALQAALHALFGPARLGPVLGDLRFTLPEPAQTAGALRALFDGGLLQAHASAVLQFALALVLVGGLQSLMTASIVDAQTRQRRDGERLLMAVGASNLVGALLGALPNGFSVARSKINLDAGALGESSRYAYVAVLLLAVLVGAPLLEHLPLAVIAGLFLASAWGLLDAWTRRSLARVGAALLRGQRPARALLGDVAVMVVVALVAGLVSLAHGVAVGVLLSMVSFVRTQSLHPVRAVASGAQRRSLKVRGASADALLRSHGGRIALVELDGALFFGTADLVALEIERAARGARHVVVDLRRVGAIDASGARLLAQAADALRRDGRTLRLASLAADADRAALLREMGGAALLEAAHPDADRALEAAEDALLAELHAEPEREAALPLSATQLGAGLDARELALLRPLLHEQRHARGEPVFRRGDASEALYVAVQGEVGIWLPGEGTAARRAVSFAPGVVFGEMGLLQRLPRSADAVAADDVVLLALDRAAADRLAAEQPALWAKLLLNLNRQLATRVRGLSEELQAALALR